MTFKTDDRVYETSITTGTGTYTLDGAAVGFTTFSGMGANNLCPYFATDDTNWEVGIGTILTGPARLERTTILRSSNADAAVNWAAGTRKIRCGWPAAMALPRSLSKSVAGSADVTLTTDEQRRRIIILTGALTGNINVIVDATPWDWIVYNNTSGAYSLTFKTTAGSGIAITQGTRTALTCDGTNVVSSITGLGAVTASGKITATAAGVDVPTSALGTCHSGTYTPIMTGVANVDAITTAAAQYMRVGNVVTVSGTFNLNPTTANSATEFGISLPIASNFSDALQACGTTAAAGFIESLAIFSDAANDRATVQGICGNTSGAHTCSYSFTYQVI
jgi:hypothetical protein